MASDSHITSVIDTWAVVDKAIHGKGEVKLEGNGLSIAGVVSVAQ